MPPSAEEEVILRERLHGKREELLEIEDNIFKARDIITLASQALATLSRSSTWTRRALDSSSKNETSE